MAIACFFPFFFILIKSERFQNIFFLSICIFASTQFKLLAHPVFFYFQTICDLHWMHFSKSLFSWTKFEIWRVRKWSLIVCLMPQMESYHSTAATTNKLEWFYAKFIHCGLKNVGNKLCIFQKQKNSSEAKVNLYFSFWDLSFFLSSAFTLSKLATIFFFKIRNPYC